MVRREVVDPQLPVPSLRVVEAVVLEAHAVGDHAPSPLLATQGTVPLWVRQRDGQGGKADSVGREKERSCLIVWCTTRSASPLRIECASPACATYTTVAVVTALSEPVRRKRAVRSAAIPALSRTSAHVTRLNFQCARGPRQGEQSMRQVTSRESFHFRGGVSTELIHHPPCEDWFVAALLSRG
jgi:hypothetical protein